MRAIIIDDKDCKELVDKLSLTKYNIEHYSASHPDIFQKFVEKGLGREDFKFVIDGIHRAFHYELVRWLQDNGWKAY